MELNKAEKEVAKRLAKLDAPQNLKDGTAIVKQIFIPSLGTMRRTLLGIDRASSEVRTKKQEFKYAFGKEEKNGQNVFKGIFVKRIR